MKRRDFALALAAAPLLAPPARAAVKLAEGRNYSRLSSPIPVAVPGKIEVIEFFGYWCPHCNVLEPELEAWAKKLPSDVNFVRVPVNWSPAHDPYQRLYYALEALGLPSSIHGKVFAAVHQQGLRLETDAGLAVFASENGIDKAKLQEVMKSFSVMSKARVATQMFKAYGIDGVPSMAVNGRFVTSSEQAGGEHMVLPVVDALIAKVRAGG